jgi:hypothetical protein
VERCYQLVQGARALLVLGSSLAVMSGYRFVVRATKLQIPIAIVSQGSTRADGCASIRVDSPLGAVLPALAAGTCAGGWDHERHVTVRFDGPYGGRHRRDAMGWAELSPAPWPRRRGHRRRRAR